VEDHRHRIGVVPQVGQFFGGVAEVGVHRHEADLEHPEDALDVLGAVIEVMGDLVLLHDAVVEQELRQPIGAPVELGPGP
jgi:hypothetical protein